MHDPHIWGWEIPVYLFLGGLSAGLMIIAALAPKRESMAIRLLPFAAAAILSAGMFALFLDLENKVNVFRFYTAFRVTSPMSWGSWILLAIYPATLLYGIALLVERGRLRPRIPEVLAGFALRNIELLRKLNIGLGIALGAYTGVLLGTLGARALWASLLLAPLFLVSGFSTAAALAMLMPLHDEERETIRKWDVYAIALEIALLTTFFIDVAVNGGLRGRHAVSLFFGGPWTAAFWAFVIILGLAAPLVLEIAEGRRHLRAAVVAPVFLLVGGFALRWIFVAAGQVS